MAALAAMVASCDYYVAPNAMVSYAAAGLKPRKMTQSAGWRGFGFYARVLAAKNSRFCCLLARSRFVLLHQFICTH